LDELARNPTEHGNNDMGITMEGRIPDLRIKLLTQQESVSQMGGQEQVLNDNGFVGGGA